MTSLTTVNVNFQLDPRLAEIDAGVNSISVQDSHDTLTDIEDRSSSSGHAFDFLVKTAGGENLGGGTTVGLTTTLQNVQYAPARTEQRGTGTGSATATDSTGITLTDGAADFVTDSVARGDWIINWTDKSITEVLAVTDLNNLQIRIPTGGTNNYFTSTDVYTVWEVADFDLSGGNFVAIDEFDADINPLFSTFGRFITKASASSATNQNSLDTEYASFDGGVTIDTVNGTAGTAFPAGTPRQPCLTMADAHAISQTRGFQLFHVVNDLTLSAIDYSDGHTFQGTSSQDNVTLTIQAGANVNNCVFKNMTISGTLDNGNRLVGCLLNSITSFDGFMENCGFNATITLGGSSQTTMIDCYSNVAGSSTPFISIGTGSALAMRGYEGGIELTNKISTDACSIDMDSGHFKVASSCTAGTITVRGNAKLTNNTGGSIVNASDLLVPSRLTNLQYLVESLRPGHVGTGDVWYWDPYGGDDSSDGKSKEFALQTWAAVDAALTDYNHDIVVCIAGNPSGTTTYTDPVKLTKNWVSIRGTGSDFVIQPTTTTVNTALFDCDGTAGISLQGITIDGTSVTGTGLLLNTAEAQLENIWIRDITGVGLYTEHCTDTHMSFVNISNCSTIGVQIFDCIGLVMDQCEIRSCTTGFESTATSLGSGGQTSFFNSVVSELTTGFNIGTNVTNTRIASSVIVNDSVTTKVIDNGTNTYYGADVAAGAVWQHQIEGTYTAEEVTRLIAAAVAGKASGLDTLSPVFRDINDTKDRITASTDTSGNRSVVTVDAA
jgi:hypothetical protein